MRSTLRPLTTLLLFAVAMVVLYLQGPRLEKTTLIVVWCVIIVLLAVKLRGMLKPRPRQNEPKPQIETWLFEENDPNKQRR